MAGLASLPPAAGQSPHPGLGAIPYADPEGTGVTFRVWAPGASTVHLSGTFNAWQAPGIAMAADPTGSTWSVDVPLAAPGDRYKFVLDGSLWRADPRARAYSPSSNNSSQVLGPPAPPAPFSRPPANALVLYELHIGTFHDPDGPSGDGGTFLDAIARLDHLVDLGVNAVSVMPCSEFLSARSWGYNPAGHFAIERDYGGREAFEEFIAACHARGIAVLIDVVHNHWGTPVGDLWRFDGSFAATNTGGIYFYEDERATTRWGPRPRFDSPPVRSFILDSLSAWLDLGCDGFRWDAVNHMVRINGNGTLLPEAVTLLQEAAELARASGAFLIAENGTNDVPGAFDAQWDIAFRSTLVDTLSAPRPADLAPSLAAAIQAVGTTSVVFAESHDTEGKHSSGTTLRWPLRMAGTNRTLALSGIALAWLSRGTPMLFQGQETLSTNVWSDASPTDWAFTPAQTQSIAFHRDLIRLRRDLDGLGPALLSPTLDAAATNGFLVIRRGDASDGPMIAIANLADSPRSLDVAFPAPGPWYRVLSTADTRYGNPGGGTATLLADADPVPVTLPPFALLLFARQYPPAGDMDDDGLPNAWETLHFGHPTNALPGAFDDADPADNLHECLADTDPHDPADFFHIASAAPEAGAFLLRFPSSSNRLYDIYCSDLPGSPPEPLATNLPGLPPLNLYPDPSPSPLRRFYHIRAKPLP